VCISAFVVPEATTFVFGTIDAGVFVLVSVLRSEHHPVMIREAVAGVAAVATDEHSVAEHFVVN